MCVWGWCQFISYRGWNPKIAAMFQLQWGYWLRITQPSRRWWCTLGESNIAIENPPLNDYNWWFIAGKIIEKMGYSPASHIWLPGMWWYVVSKAIINHPNVDGLYHHITPHFMVKIGDGGSYRFTNIISHCFFGAYVPTWCLTIVLAIKFHE